MPDAAVPSYVGGLDLLKRKVKDLSKTLQRLYKDFYKLKNGKEKA